LQREYNTFATTTGPFQDSTDTRELQQYGPSQDSNELDNEQDRIDEAEVADTFGTRDATYCATGISTL